MQRSEIIRHAFAIAAVVTLSSLMWSGTWWEVNARGTYTEGMSREPTLWANYTINSEKESILVEITNATPLIVYMNKRELIPDPATSNSSDNSTDSSDGDSTSDDPILSDNQSGLTLDSVRLLVERAAILTITLFVLGGFHRWFKRGGFFVWGVTLIALLVLTPLAVLGDYSLSPDPQASGNLTTGDEAGEWQFAHSKSSSSVELMMSGISLGFENSGYDLGLVNESDRDMVRDSEPIVGGLGSDSYIEFTGQVEASIGTGIISWCVVPIIPLLLSLLGRRELEEISRQQPNPDGEEDAGARSPHPEARENSVFPEILVSVDDAQDDISAGECE